ncbi:response regulator [Pseudoalteromonas spongiae]|uniref:GGDEF domain-containing response regulator n=1 Tax=Pseudoalteromonas spongiae TaxID=298657 RepID=UPI000C2D366F|nr:response regulator [Pseudoalteromonas spongiae]
MLPKLLLIEDNPSISKIQRHVALRIGYQVDIADSLASAIDLIEVNDYFCAVVDYVLPDASNGEAIPLTIGASIPTIVMTGKLDDKTRDTVMQYPVVDYITKESRQAYTYLETQLKRLPRNENVRVLIVDDSRNTRKLIKSYLLRHKYLIAEAVDGVSALEQLEQFDDIKVIITDNEMPNMNGVTLTSKIREKFNSEDKVIIGISGTDDNRVSANFLKNGADDYLRKPFYPEEFYCRVSQNLDMQENIATIRRQANSDYLTGLPNRRYFFEQANSLLKRQKFAHQVAMLDIDHFKAVNDNYGHDAGDIVLKEVSRLFDTMFGKDHLVARLGGEEFAVLFKDENHEDNQALLEQFRETVSQLQIDCADQTLCVTISIGVTVKDTQSTDEVLKLADLCLYQAKEQGRNRVIAG